MKDNKLLLVMTAAMLALALPYLLVITGVWGAAVSDGSDAWSGLPIRDPDDLPIIHQVSNFTMTDQLGETVSKADLEGQVWLADVIFTRCPGPCAMMSSRMADLQDTIPEHWPVRLISLTADPQYDTPDVLRVYAENYQTDAQRWSFLHASKTAIVDLAVNNLKLIVLDKEQEQQSANDLFIHSTTFALVDKHGRLRGAFESLAPGRADLIEVTTVDRTANPTDHWETELRPRLLRAIQRLMAED